MALILKVKRKIRNPEGYDIIIVWRRQTAFSAKEKRKKAAWLRWN